MAGQQIGESIALDPVHLAQTRKPPRVPGIAQVFEHQPLTQAVAVQIVEDQVRVVLRRSRIEQHGFLTRDN